MYEFKYDIEVDEGGRPYINLSKEFNDAPEHKFMVLEITLSLLYNAMSNEVFMGRNPEFKKEMEISTAFLHDLSDQVAVLVLEGMNRMDDINDMLNNNGNEED